MCSAGKSTCRTMLASYSTQNHSPGHGWSRICHCESVVRILLLLSYLSPQLCFFNARAQSCGCWGYHPHSLNHFQKLLQKMKTLNLKILKQDLLYFWKGWLLSGTHYVAPAVLKLAAILLPLSFKWRGSLLQGLGAQRGQEGTPARCFRAPGFMSLGQHVLRGSSWCGDCPSPLTA